MRSITRRLNSQKRLHSGQVKSNWPAHLSQLEYSDEWLRRSGLQQDRKGWSGAVSDKQQESYQQH
jgi:hypothetical protein